MKPEFEPHFKSNIKWHTFDESLSFSRSVSCVSSLRGPTFQHTVNYSREPFVPPLKIVNFSLEMQSSVIVVKMRQSNKYSIINQNFIANENADGKNAFDTRVNELVDLTFKCSVYLCSTRRNTLAKRCHTHSAFGRVPFVCTSSFFPSLRFVTDTYNLPNMKHAPRVFLITMTTLMWIWYNFCVLCMCLCFCTTDARVHLFE